MNNPISKAFIIAAILCTVAALASGMLANLCALSIQQETIASAVTMSSAIMALGFLAMAYITQSDNDRRL